MAAKAQPIDISQEAGRWAKVYRDGDRVIVTARYPNPKRSWILDIFWKIFGTIIPLWLIFRLVLPEAAQRLLPRFDNFVSAIMTVPNDIAASFINPEYNFNFGRGLDVISGAGFIIAFAIIALSIRLLKETNFDLILLSLIFPGHLKVVLSKDETIIRWKSYQTREDQHFKLDEQSLVRSRMTREEVFARSKSLVFVYGYRRIVIADIYGLDRAEGILAGIHAAEDMINNE